MNGTLMLVLFAVLIAINIVLLAVLLRLARKDNNGESSKDRDVETLLLGIEKSEKKMLDELARTGETLRQSQAMSSRGLREEISNNITRFANLINQQITQLQKLLHAQYEGVRNTVAEQLNLIRAENSKKLDEMRETVNEKLHSTLEKRLGEAFQQVGDRLQKVHEGLGEMQNLASGVGDLKKVLTNVKTRGTLGEIQLERQITELLTPQQYEKNVTTKKRSRNFVEFAIKLPGPDEDGEPVWLPIDSKFPLNTYEKLNAAYEKGLKEDIDRLSRALSDEIKRFARDIRDKYISPPSTTDFGMMYLPTEGLYAEVLRIDGLFEDLTMQYKIVPVGPTTFAAFISSLQMGFRTYNIQKRSSEVWTLLGKVKTDFGKFGELLEKTRKKLDEAGKTIEDASQRTKAIERRLGRVEELPPEESMRVLEDAS